MKKEYSLEEKVAYFTAEVAIAAEKVKSAETEFERAYHLARLKRLCRILESMISKIINK